MKDKELQFDRTCHVLYSKPCKKQIRLPGTEHMEKEYRQKWFHVKVCLPIIPFAVLACFTSSGLMLLLW